MFLHGVPTDRLDRVIVPDLAHLLVRGLRDDFDELHGGEDSLRWICDQNGLAWEWRRWDYKQRERLIEKLLELIDHGVFAVLQTTSFLPLLPAFQQIDGQWQVTRDVRSLSRGAHGRFTFDLERRKREERERKAWQERNQPPKPEIVEPAVGPGYRRPTLGPHDGLHNRNWDSVSVKPESFKTIKQVDMENLSREDAIARKALKGQGWKGNKVEQIIKSGNGFTVKELQPGDKLHGFGTAGRPKNIKDSAYWMDEAEFKNVESKFFKNGQWDKEGVKNHLALPCFNRATDVTTVEITQPTTGLTSTVGKAREVLQYTDTSGYTTGPLGKIMGGGGKQITVNPAHVTKI